MKKIKFYSYRNLLPFNCTLELHLGLFVLIFFFLHIHCTQTKKKFDTSKVYQRILPANIFSAKLLWQLGPAYRKRVVAVPSMIDDSRYSNFENIWPKHIPRFQTAIDEIISYKPDLVILASFNSNELKTLLDDLHIDTLVLYNFEGFDAYVRNLKTLSQIRVEEDGFEKRRGRDEFLERNFQKRLKSIQARAKNMPPIKIMSYVYGSTHGKKTTLNDAIQMAGFINLAAEKNITYYKKISLEELLVSKADVILIASSRNTCKQSEKNFLSHMNLKKIHSKIIALPENIISSIDEDMLLISETLQDRLEKGR